MIISNGDQNINRIDHSVIKSPNDKNDYYYDILPNGLRYIVVSNKDIDKSAVSLDVYIGSADDPKEYPGLAHCLEHIIFLGTKKYPNASEFDDFLNLNSGFSNANTSLDHTNYHFDISNDQLEKGMDMFSEFYFEPLFKEELINKELNSIDSEFKLDYRNDFNRELNLFLFEGYKNSQFNTFINGNLETLQKPEIREKVIEFYNINYDPKIMTVCVFSNKSIEELKNLVIKYFSKIPNKINFNKTPKNILYDEKNMGYLYKIKSIKDMSYIQFVWVINKSYNSYYKSEPYNYVISVLGHESKHSLTAYLKNKGYIYDLLSYFNTTYDLFTRVTIKIKLTDTGYSNINEIIQIVLSYIDYLQKEELHEDFFEEIKKTSEISFYLDEQIEPIELVENIASALTVIKPNEKIYISSKIEEYRPDLIKEFMDYLTLHNLNIYVLSSKLNDNKSKNEDNCKFNIEKIYGTEYIKEKMDFSTFLIDIKSNNEIDLAYPELNPFLPSNLNMIDLTKANINLSDYLNPQKIYDNERIIWYKPIIKYNMPKVYLSAKAYLSNMNIDFNSYTVYCDIFTKIINKELSEFLYLGETSENSMDFGFTISACLINIEGYTDSIEKYIIEYFHNLYKLIDLRNIDDIYNKLNTILDLIIKKINNFYMGDVCEQTKSKFKIIIKEINATKLEICQKFKKEIEKKIIPTDFLTFMKNIFKKVKYEWLIEGNIFYKDAEKIIIRVEDEMKKLFGGENQNKSKEILSINEIRKQRIINVPEDIIYRYNFFSKDKENESSTILIYFQIGNFYFNDKNIFNKKIYEEYVKNKGLLYVFHSAFYEIFYDELRTQQQIGYDVDLQIRNDDYINGLYFFISSSKYSPDEMIVKINNFIVENDINNEDKFSDEDFESYRKSCIVELLQKPLTLDEEFSRDFSYISNRTYKFSLREDLINYLQNIIKKKDVIEFFNKYIYKKAKRLEVALYSSKKNSEEKKEKMDIEIENNDKNINNELDKVENNILPSFENRKIEIIEDIKDFHRYTKFYDNEFY